MNTTTNYGLKLYEGTDLFNPLTVENVNTGDIDTAMKAISDHSVGTATELTTGTVHAITRADTDRDVFLFVATSNFTAGDTFTLDGNQVSALTPDGQQLATGSYVIGSSVLCALHDTLITVYVNPAKAKDADMLDGHDSSYYATDSDLDTVAGTIQAVSDKVGTAVLTTTAPDCSGAINELNTRLSHIGELTHTEGYTAYTVAPGGVVNEITVPETGTYLFISYIRGGGVWYHKNNAFYPNNNVVTIEGATYTTVDTFTVGDVIKQVNAGGASQTYIASEMKLVRLA
jgi:hypothetical protein